MKHPLFLKNALILTVTSLLLRTLGMVFRVWLSNTIGAGGMGLYQLVLSVYVFASAFATVGICTAVTRLTAELSAKGFSSRKILSRAISFSLIISAVSIALLYFFARPIALNLVGDIRAEKAIKILGLGIPFMSTCSCLRGYFIAARKTTAPSIGQLAEQLVRMLVIVFLVSRISGSIELSCAAILFGDGIAEAAGCGLLYLLYRAEKRKEKTTPLPSFPVTKKLIHIALPITAGRYIQTALRTVENLIVPSRLALHMGNSRQGLEQFGMIKGMAIPLLFFPASFLTAFSTLMIPEISEALERKNYTKVRLAVEKAIGITLIISVLIGGAFFLCGGEISSLLYDKSDIGYLIITLSPLVPFMYLECVCDGILKGLDQQAHSFAYSVIDSLSRIGLIWFLLPIKGMQGFLLIMIFSNLLTSILNIRRLLKVTKMPFLFGSWLIKPLISVSVGIAVGKMAMRISQAPLAAAACGIFSLAAIYLLIIFFMGELKIAEQLL